MISEQSQPIKESSNSNNKNGLQFNIVVEVLMSLILISAFFYVIKNSGSYTIEKSQMYPIKFIYSAQYLNTMIYVNNLTNANKNMRITFKLLRNDVSETLNRAYKATITISQYKNGSLVTTDTFDNNFNLEFLETKSDSNSNEIYNQRINGYDRLDINLSLGGNIRDLSNILVQYNYINSDLSKMSFTIKLILFGFTIYVLVTIFSKISWKARDNSKDTIMFYLGVSILLLTNAILHFISENIAHYIDLICYFVFFAIFYQISLQKILSHKFSIIPRNFNIIVISVSLLTSFIQVFQMFGQIVFDFSVNSKSNLFLVNNLMVSIILLSLICYVYILSESENKSFIVFDLIFIILWSFVALISSIIGIFYCNAFPHYQSSFLIITSQIVFSLAMIYVHSPQKYERLPKAFQ